MERKMKDSGTPWIGYIPEHWNISKIGQLYDNRYERVSDKDFEPLSVTMQGILPQLDTAVKTDDGDNRKLVRKGDFAINSRSDRRGSCGISPRDGSVSLINLILAPRTSMNANYYNWLFHTPLFADEFYSWGHGIVADLWTTRWQEMKNIAIPVPPLSEQEAIAAHLEKKCGEIDELIEVEQQMISDLESYRQSVITEAVTHGLNPDVVTSYSSIPWIASKPKNWKEIRLKFLVQISTGDKDTIMANDEGEYPFFVRSPKVEHIDTFSYDGEAILMAGDGVGAGRVFHHFIGKFDWHQRVYNLHNLSSNIYGRFLFYFLLSNFHKLIDAGSAKSTVDSVRLPMLTNFITLVPPLAEQQEIADYLDAKCADIDELIKVKQEKIETLKQYRQSLIFEAVTGKTTIE